MPDLLSPDSLPRRPESLRHSRTPSLPIAEQFCSPQWSPLLTPQTATDIDDQQSQLDPDDSSTRALLRPRSYTDADDSSIRTLLRPGSYSSYEPIHDSAQQEETAEQYIPTEDGAHGVQDDQEESFRLSTLKPPLETATSEQPVHTKPWETRPSASSQCRLAVDQGGWFWHQMLVDRSLRSMAVLTTVFAFMMLILCFAYFGDFINRTNKKSTSALHLFLNIAATATLGMSNTFQTIVSSLKANEVRWAFSKYGDARVGTNSPFNINRKKTGKINSWLAWGLLVSTSIPIHFLINSVVGPSFYVTPPGQVVYHPIPLSNSTNMYQYGASSSADLSCWSAFRTGIYTFPSDFNLMGDITQTTHTYSSVSVAYVDENCTEYRNSTRNFDLLGEYDSSREQLSAGSCLMGDMVVCALGGDMTQSCRLNIRMSAALTLAGCLVLKAAYMIVLNLQARKKVRTRCLTYGDVVVASALDPKLRIQNECLVNAVQGHRHKVNHTCHKHCTNPAPSETGDNLGHCQKCKKFNITDRAADLVHPVIAIKYKSSLISNLGVTAISQMMMLMLGSLVMVGVSIMLAVLVGIAATTYKRECSSFPTDSMCSTPLGTYLNENFGGFGGFNSSIALTSLAPDNLGSELTAYSIANGAQFLYSLLYLLLIYNVTLISMEHDWGTLEKRRQRLRCTIVRGSGFVQSYLLQLPKRVLYPAMAFSALMHWMLGQAISTIEITWVDRIANTSHSQNSVVYAVYPVWISTLLMLAMTSICWWAFTYRREGFIPQMYGSMRACGSATTELDSFSREGIMWGDLTAPDLHDARFRHAGLSSGIVGPVIPAELYCGRDRPHLKMS
ncbi:hypothetical protein MMC13_007509 [Lambiella insularis]|nr:hypothetical protein [Lambiella insularis]